LTQFRVIARSVIAVDRGRSSGIGCELGNSERNHMKKINSSVCVLLSAFWLWPGCTSPAAAGDACAVDSDCASGLRCRAGLCEAVPNVGEGEGEGEGDTAEGEGDRPVGEGEGEGEGPIRVVRHAVSRPLSSTPMTGGGFKVSGDFLFAPATMTGGDFVVRPQSLQAPRTP
jgi:hypothetical protein